MPPSDPSPQGSSPSGGARPDAAPRLEYHPRRVILSPATPARYVLWSVGLAMMTAVHAWGALAIVGARDETSSILVGWIVSLALLMIAGPLRDKGPRRLRDESMDEHMARMAGQRLDPFMAGFLAYILGAVLTLLGAALGFATGLQAPFRALFALSALAGPVLAAATFARVSIKRARLVAADPARYVSAPGVHTAPPPELPLPELRLPPAEGAAARFAVFDRAGRSLSAWRDEVRRAVRRAEGYRDAVLDRDECLRVLEDVRSPVERRIAVALALGAERDTATVVRVMAAAEDPDPRVRVALERALDGSLEDKHVAAALRVAAEEAPQSARRRG